MCARSSCAAVLGWCLCIHFLWSFFGWTAWHFDNCVLFCIPTRNNCNYFFFLLYAISGKENIIFCYCKRCKKWTNFCEFFFLFFTVQSNIIYIFNKIYIFCTKILDQNKKNMYIIRKVYIRDKILPSFWWQIIRIYKRHRASNILLS